jgi:acyl-CoA thioester hydrolase
MRSETKLTVRYAETDQMGIVHHSHYPVWFEAGRTDFLKGMGMSYGDMEKSGVLLPLSQIFVKFLSPAKYADEILVRTGLQSVSRARAVFSYQVFRAGDGVLLATGETMHAFTDRQLKPINAQKALPIVYSALCQTIKEDADH